MTLKLELANVVVIANQFNPSVVSQLWLVENELVGRDDFQPGCVFTDVFANVATRVFGLFVSPPQLQFAPKGDVEGQQRIVVERLGKIIDLLPHTPYTAAGLNFTWHIIPKSGDTAELSRGLFFRRDSKLFAEFDEANARFGSYLSKDAIGCRLKLDAKPITVTVKANNESENRLQFAFNFHFDVGKDEPAAKQIRALLERWDEARMLTEKIMNTMPDGS